MAICTLHYFSQALAKQVGATVILPEDNGGPYPVFYLLHGLSDDHAHWTRKSSVERHADGLPLIIVMPDGGRGFYTDAREGFAYESAIVDDLIPFIDHTFRSDARREGRVIGGLSMGGYGALKLALAHPDLFCSAVSHSGALAAGHVDIKGEDDWSKERARIFGPQPEGGPDDIFSLAERIDRALLPALRLDCGLDDGLLPINRAFHAHLEALGISHEYAEFPGGHTWEYWDCHIRDALAFQTRVLGIAKRDVAHSLIPAPRRPRR